VSGYLGALRNWKPRMPSLEKGLANLLHLCPQPPMLCRICHYKRRWICSAVCLRQCSIPDDGHRSCSALSWISSTQLQGGSCDPWQISKGLYRTRPCLPHRQKETWCIEGSHEWCPVSSYGILIQHDTDADKFRKGMNKPSTDGRLIYFKDKVTKSGKTRPRM